MTDPTTPRQPKPPRQLHLWEIAAVREAFWLLLFIFACWAAYVLRAILAPLLIAFALAYVTDPLIRMLQARARIPRVLTSSVLLLLLLAAATAFFLWLMPRFVEQLTQLVEQLPVYWESLQQRYASFEASLATLPVDTQPALRSVDPESVVSGLFSGVGSLFGVLGTAFGTATYMLVLFLLVPILFVFFATYYDRLAAIHEYLPASRRERIRELLRGINAAFSGYVRGQLVVALFTTIGFCVGFYIVGVPYWFVVALIGGTLSLIPYGQCSGWLLAIVLKYAETQTGAVEFSWFGILVAPSLVYAVTQSMESWVITPLAQGEATDLHPVVVLVALLIGGTLAGIVGLILAVPVTASIRLLLREVALPRLKAWAQAN